MRSHDTGGGIEVIQFTMAMLAVFIAVFGAQLTHRDLSFLSAYPWRIAAGEPWRLLTSTALHGSILHIAFNAIMFYRFSSAIERWLGPWITMLMYIFFAIGSNAAQILWSAGLGAIGASGVVYGLFGFLWVTRRRYDIAAEATPPSMVQTMLGWLVVCAVLNMLGSPIANVAHIFGLLLGWLLGRIVVSTKSMRLPIMAGTAILWIGLVLLTYGPVWERTIIHLPYLGNMVHRISFLLPQSQWQDVESRIAQRGPGFTF
jgi:membrane associated rhomboid family serine protease